MLAVVVCGQRRLQVPGVAKPTPNIDEYLVRIFSLRFVGRAELGDVGVSLRLLVIVRISSMCGSSAVTLSSGAQAIS